MASAGGSDAALQRTIATGSTTTIAAATATTATQAAAATSLTDLGGDVLTIVASHCGKSAVALACTCHATRHVWRDAQHSAQLLAHLLLSCEPVLPLRAHGPGGALRVVCERGVARLVSSPHAVHLLLNAGADVHARNDKALREAADRGLVDTVAVLLAHGASVNAMGGAPLIGAVHNGHVDAARLLLDAGADPNAQEGTPLFTAATNGHVDVVQLLLERGANVHTGRDWALRHAAKAGREHVVSALLAAGADVHVQADEALAAAAAGGHEGVMRVLLAAGASVLSHIVEIAVQQGPGVLAVILEHGPPLEGDLMDLALWAATRAGRPACVQLLLAHGAPSQAAKDAAVVQAARYGRVEIARAVVEAGADVGGAAAGGALCAAARGNHVLMMQHLLVWGADLAGEDGQRALRLLVRNGQAAAAEALAAHADVQHKGL